ncbi:hypothetical protein BDF22DRAFT_734753 [Syncephalis plumigaleata]|nr:hypothetical protein BDF22DRAFT_734753 [Syncephalis plumigaleata]
MIIDSDTEDYSATGLTTIKKVDWPADAPTQCQLLIVQPVTGPLSLPSSTARDLGEARIHFESQSIEESSLSDRHARRMHITIQDNVVAIYCDAILWEHADTLMAGRLMARFSPQQVILADFVEANAISIMMTGEPNREISTPVSSRVARGLPAAILSLCEIRNLPAYYLTQSDSAIITESTASNISMLLYQLAQHVNMPLLQKLYGKRTRQTVAHDNLYI